MFIVDLDRMLHEHVDGWWHLFILWCELVFLQFSYLPMTVSHNIANTPPSTCQKLPVFWGIIPFHCILPPTDNATATFATQATHASTLWALAERKHVPWGTFFVFFEGVQPNLVIKEKKKRCVILLVVKELDQTIYSKSKKVCGFRFSVSKNLWKKSANLNNKTLQQNFVKITMQNC